jgi:hydroxyacylglutathione hydrolase
MPLQIVTIACLSDNYAYLMRDEATGRVGLVDAPDAAPIAAAIESRGWPLDMILITHHHDDHVAGVDALRRRYGSKIVGAAADGARLPALDIRVSEGDKVALGESDAAILDVPGHTVGHIAYHFAGAGALFSADSLMALGCGRLFEGSAEQMWGSLSKMAALPADTLIYSGHEYSEANARFALSIDPENPALQARAEQIARDRQSGEPTVPVSLELELATNPFLRANDAALKSRLGLSGEPDVRVFAEIRGRKDKF